MTTRPLLPARTLDLDDLTRRVRDAVNGLYQGTQLPSRWDDVRVPAITAKPGATRVPDFAQYRDNGAGSTGVYTYLFDAAINEELFFALQLPHRYKEFSHLRPHVHWSPMASATGTVVWGLETTLCNIDGTFGTTTLRLSTATAGVQYAHQMALFSTITGSDTTISAMLLGRIYRDASATADTYSADAALLEIDFHIEVDEHGSQLPSEKWR